VEQPEAGPIPGTPEVVARHNEVAPGIRFQDEVPGADPVEKGPLRKGQIILTGGLHRLPDDSTKSEGITVPVAEGRVGRQVGGLIDGVLENVDAIEVDPEVFVGVQPGVGPAETMILEVQPAAHPHQMPDLDGVPGVPTPLPLRHRRRLVQAQLSLLHQNPHEGCGDALPLGPGDLWRVLRKPRSVAFADDLSLVEDHQGSGVLGLGHGPIQRRVKAGFIHFRENAVSPNVPRGPRLGDGIRQTSRNRYRGEKDILSTGWENRTALIPVVFGGAPGDAGPPHAGGLRLRVDLILEILLPIEVGEGPDVLFQNPGRVSLIVAANHEGAGAEVVGSHGRRVLPNRGIGPLDLSPEEGWEKGEEKAGTGDPPTKHSKRYAQTHGYTASKSGWEFQPGDEYGLEGNRTRGPWKWDKKVGTRKSLLIS